MGRPPRAFDALGPALRDLRIERGLTQVELAARAGISKSMLSLYEGGRRRPQLETLERLIEALGITLGELAMRLESRPRDKYKDPARRGPKRVVPEAPLPGELQEEAVKAATEILQGIAALLWRAVQGDHQRSEAEVAIDPDPESGEA